MTSEAADGYRRRRTEQREDSRVRILDAAVACLIEGGIENATTLQIQARAGISRGGLLHHFPSRGALLVAASQHLATLRLAVTAERAAQIARVYPEGRDRLNHMVELLWEASHEPQWWAALELWTSSRTDDEIAASLRPEERRLGGVIRTLVDDMFGPACTGHPRYREVRELLLSSMRGVALTYTFERRDPSHDPHLDTWKTLVGQLLET